jgi:hypothetical protein
MLGTGQVQHSPDTSYAQYIVPHFQLQKWAPQHRMRWEDYHECYAKILKGTDVSYFLGKTQHRPSVTENINTESLLRIACNSAEIQT